MNKDDTVPRIVIRPNCNFSGRGAALLFCAMALPLLGMASAWAMKGYWPILPFAGLELLVLGAALAITVQRGRHREVIRFGRRHVRVQQGYAGHRKQVEFPRPWTRAWIEPGSNPAMPGRLFLGASGACCELGACLTEGERQSLCRRLRELTRAPVPPEKQGASL